MSNQEGIQNAYCDGVRGMINYMMYQHVPRSYGQLNEFLPHHLYYDRILPPFAMKMVPASNICNRFVIKRSMRYREKATPTSAVWFPDSDFVVTSLNNGTLVKWDAVTYTHKGRKSVSNTSINCMRLSHDGQFIIAAGDNGNVFYLTKALTESCPLKNDQESILACAISARDNYVITGGDNKYIKVWKIAANEITFERNLGELQNSVTSVDASGVGSLVLSGCKDGSVGVWDLRTRKSLKRLTDNDEQINVVRFCPTNENYFITAGKGRTIRLYDARTFCQLRNFRGHNYDITALAFSPEDGTVFVSGDYNGHLNYWSIYNELPLYTATKAHDRSIKDICFSPLSLAMVSLGFLLSAFSHPEMTTISSSGSEIAPETAKNWWLRTSPPSEVVPMSRNIDYSTNESFKIDLMIPSIGKIDQGWIGSLR
ncbi:uncharacterized protein [Blastocystis hominis]|uniref:Uncharacterized protein n=1 Tax=Blastocystis hominis TaxID=12968 RepID=D8M5C5_BLAHO|nr:uncharacterized protein [Blastocystis hominis]CBK23264.2 unnamed protein product [Blastocystis hominis]|eukprot:XP_012897312.1 uncharacterized protein [Blastocystis hominis]